MSKVNEKGSLKKVVKEYNALLNNGELEVYDISADRGYKDFKRLLLGLKNDFNTVSVDWIESVDKKMVETGFTSVITLNPEDEDLYSEYFLCKKLKSLPDSVWKLLNMNLDDAYNLIMEGGDFLFDILSNDYGCSRIITTFFESYDNEDEISIQTEIILGDGVEDFEFFNVSPAGFCSRINKDDFYSNNIPSEYKFLTDIVKLVTKSLKGITIERLSVHMTTNLAIDLKNEYNKGTFSYFVGLSRTFRNNPNIDYKPDPVTKDTYDVAIIVHPTNNPCVVKRRSYYERLLEFVNSDECEEWELEEIFADDEETVIGYNTYEGTIMKDDTVESLIAKDMDYIKKVNKKQDT